MMMMMMMIYSKINRFCFAFVVSYGMDVYIYRGMFLWRYSCVYVLPFLSPSWYVTWVDFLFSTTRPLSNCPLFTEHVFSAKGTFRPKKCARTAQKSRIADVQNLLNFRGWETSWEVFQPNYFSDPRMRCNVPFLALLRGRARRRSCGEHGDDDCAVVPY